MRGLLVNIQSQGRIVCRSANVAVWCEVLTLSNCEVRIPTDVDGPFYLVSRDILYASLL